jgi:hypothetical protein
MDEGHKRWLAQIVAFEIIETIVSTKAAVKEKLSSHFGEIAKYLGKSC